MSTLKTNAVQIGQSNTATANFALTAANADGTVKLARGNVGATTQDVMTVASDGKVDFPAGLSAFLGSNQSLTLNGYQKFPGGLIIQWGEGNYSGNGGVVTFPIPFPNAVFQILSTDGGTGVHNLAALKNNLSSFLNYSLVPGSTPPSYSATTYVRWFAIGF